MLWFRTLIHGDKKGGFTVFWADDGLDTGPILLQRECDVLPDDTVNTIYKRFLFPEGVKGTVRMYSTHDTMWLSVSTSTAMWCMQRVVLSSVKKLHWPMVCLVCRLTCRLTNGVCCWQVDAVKMIAAGTAPKIKQPEEGATYECIQKKDNSKVP